MRILKNGSTGPAVQLLQLALNRAGFGRLEKDGIFGSATASAVSRFQRARGLGIDGIVGPETHKALLPWYTGFVNHTVRRGDTLWQTAQHYSTTVSAIKTANPLIDPLNLRVGSSLVVPLGFPVVPADIDYCSQLVGYCVRGIAARYPFVSVGELGKSVMGRSLWYISMGMGQNRVLYNASHHANEWITTPVLLRFAEELASAFASGGDIGGQSAAEIFDYASVTLVPAVNPDGIDLVTGELTQGEFYNSALKIAENYPRFAFPSGWKANIRGVDLNLQYPAGWEQARENKFALGITSPAPGDYVGNEPLCTPEARAMLDFTRIIAPSLTLSYHTQGQVIYWKYLDLEPPMSRSIAEAFSYASGYAVEDTPFASGFAGYKDWFIQDYDRPGYTVEAGLGENPLPISQLDAIYERNRDLLTLAALVT